MWFVHLNKSEDVICERPFFDQTSWSACTDEEVGIESPYGGILTKVTYVSIYHWVHFGSNIF